MHRALLCFTLLLCLLLAGCGNSGQGIVVEGTVNAGGQPVSEGTIAFIPIDIPKGKSVGSTISDGKFTIPATAGALPGKYRVEIKATRKTGRQFVDTMSQDKKMVDEIEQYLPAKYNTTSNLTAEIEDQPRSTQTFDLPLP